MAAAYAFGRGRKVRPGAVRVGKEGRPFAVVGRWKKTFLIFLLTEGLLFGNVPSCRGAVAQLGERLNGIQEVRSSILLSSTKKEIRVCGNADPFFVSGHRSTDSKKAGAMSPGFFVSSWKRLPYAYALQRMAVFV